eukprot:4927405-Pleurochrysis_carterae.AAC.1
MGMFADNTPAEFHGATCGGLTGNALPEATDARPANPTDNASTPEPAGEAAAPVPAADAEARAPRLFSSLRTLLWLFQGDPVPVRMIQTLEFCLALLAGAIGAHELVIFVDRAADQSGSHLSPWTARADAQIRLQTVRRASTCFTRRRVRFIPSRVGRAHERRPPCGIANQGNGLTSNKV